MHAIAANLALARSDASSIRRTSACSRVFSTSRSAVAAATALATTMWPEPASVPAASTTSAATSVVASTSRRLATQ
jgi:hypothetical protein